MDSINITYMKLDLILSKNNALLLTLDALNLQVIKKDGEIDYWKTQSTQFNNVILEYQKRLDLKDKIHAADIEILQEKSRGKFKSFIIGTGVGALIVGILVIK